MSPGKLVIAIDGAASTGKTTLLRELEPWFQGRLVMVDEAVRTVAPSYGVRETAHWPELFSDALRLASFYRSLERFAKHREEAAAPCVVDSSLYQIAVYRSMFVGVLDTTLARSRNYVAILYCGLGGGTEDGFRFLERRNEFDEVYRDTVRRDFLGDFIELPTGSKRAAVAREVIEGLLVSNG